MWPREEDRSIFSPIMNEKGLGILDTLFVCILVSILIGTVIPYYQRLEREAKEAALQTGLVNIRKGIELYQALQGSFPRDLRNLVKKRYVIAARNDSFFSGEYLTAQATDAQGNLIDPFGVPYIYNE